MGNKKSGNLVDMVVKIVLFDNKVYEKVLCKFYVELVKLQCWVVYKGLKVCIVFEGWDGVGKGGIIKVIIECVSLCIFWVVVLFLFIECEKSQFYFQCYIKYFLVVGEIVIFDCSWYNCVGVEWVMGFCMLEEVQKFFDGVLMVECGMVELGIILFKYWLEVFLQEQECCLWDCIDDGCKIWKFLLMDIKFFNCWDEYIVVCDVMFVVIDIVWVLWFVVCLENKKCVCLNIIIYLLLQIFYEVLLVEFVMLLKCKIGKMKQINFFFCFILEKF